ncbi:MmcQ/YjbR family DNA-binding protein [Micromonospora profundi]|uniref:MmcQ/YjbR family DNA-binding protein n=1 Tax=Micromonospora sp. NRRL B-16802 TaxID=1415541 RepID=UPI001E321377|nr:MmcQ/YjbR family DNA-binding protein [Micromonospora sp. NRRL B-16802]
MFMRRRAADAGVQFRAAPGLCGDRDRRRGAVELLARVREICLALPEVTERPSHGSPTWFVRDKSVFVTLHADGHHQNDFPHLWCAAPPGAQAELTAADPERFFRPPYVGGRGWLGVRLDGTVDWVEIDELCRDAYREIAPKGLVALLDASA